MCLPDLFRQGRISSFPDLMLIQHPLVGMSAGIWMGRRSNVPAFFVSIRQVLCRSPNNSVVYKTVLAASRLNAKNSGSSTYTACSASERHKNGFMEQNNPITTNFSQVVDDIKQIIDTGRNAAYAAVDAP